MWLGVTDFNWKNKGHHPTITLRVTIHTAWVTETSALGPATEILPPQQSLQLLHERRLLLP